VLTIVDIDPKIPPNFFFGGVYVHRSPPLLEQIDGFRGLMDLAVLIDPFSPIRAEENGADAVAEERAKGF
jgi:hypothetical protein